MRRTDSRTLREIIGEILKEYQIDRKLKERDLIRQWEEVAGINVSRSTSAIYIREGTLYVSIRSSVIRNELIWIRDELRKELNRRAGEELIRELVIR